MTDILAEIEACRRCGGPNCDWVAPSPFWNAVMRGGCIDGQPQFDDLVCISCFIVLAQHAGLASRWRLMPVDPPDDLQTVTPSGRVWDADRWVWRG